MSILKIAIFLFKVLLDSFFKFKRKELNQMGNILKPVVYLVGRPSLAEEGLKKFFEDENVFFSIEGNPLTRMKFLEEKQKEWLINTSNAAEILCMTAGKICYNAYGVGNNDIEPYIRNIIESGHHSVIEHVQWNFIIKGSRIWSHEHVRHRIGVAISQRSQRYVKESDANFIMPPEIRRNTKTKDIFKKSIERNQKAYNRLIRLLSEDIKEQVPDSTLRVKTVRSSARSLMPNATETFIFWSANARALRHFIDLRAKQSAEWEIREVAIQILKIMREEAPNIFADYEIKKTPEGLEIAVTDLNRRLERIREELEEQYKARSDEPLARKRIAQILEKLKT
jgi:thymidylate synthase (FAD)